MPICLKLKQLSPLDSKKLQSYFIPSGHQKLLLPTNEVCEGYFFTPVCHSVHRGAGIPACIAGLQALTQRVSSRVWLGGSPGPCLGSLQAHTQGSPGPELGRVSRPKPRRASRPTPRGKSPGPH